MVLANVQKKVEKPVFYRVFWPRFNSRQKIPSITWFLLYFAPLHSLIFRFSPSFRFFHLGIEQEIFSTNHLDLLVFLYQSPKGFGGFSSIEIPVFLHYFLLGFGNFLPITTLIIYLHAQWSLLLRREVIIMTWSLNLVIWPNHLIWLFDIIHKPHLSNFIRSQFQLTSKHYHT